MSKNGYITPSQFSRIMVAADIKKDTFGAGAMTYAMELVAQRNGVEMPEARGAALDHGNDLEWQAKRAYEDLTLATIVDVDYPIQWPDNIWVRGIPDGLIMDKGIVEIKCPYNPVNHLRNLQNGYQYEADYCDQIQGYLLITGRTWCDFISYDPRWPQDKQLYVRRIERDKPYLETLEDRLHRFGKIVDKLMTTI